MRPGIAMLMLALAAMGAGASGASAAGRFVAPDGSDAGNDCLEQLPLSARCATIQHAIDVADPGDSVNVVAGVYDENLTIDKRLDLISQAGVPKYWYEPETRIEGGSGRAITVEASKVRITGFEVATTGSGPAILVAGPTADELQVEENVITGGSVGLQLEAGGADDQLNFNSIEGTGDGIRLSGAEYTDLSIRGNKFAAPIDDYAVLADGTGTIENLTMDGNEMTAPTVIAARVKEGQNGEESQISGNTFRSGVGPQLAVDAAEVRIMENSFDGHNSAGCLRIIGSQGGLLPSEHVLISGENEFLDCNPYGIELGPEVDQISIYDNEFPGSFDGVLVGGASPWDVTEHVRIEDNRIVGTSHFGVDNQASGTVDAELNWWGCNAGPGAPGCDGASAGVNADDNIVLGALVGPRKKETGIIELPRGSSITLNPGEQAEVAAVLTAGGGGIVLGAATKEVPVGFSSPLGTISPSTSTFQNGWTRSFFTAGSTPGEGSIVVSFDNQRTLVPVTICCKPAEAQPSPLSPSPAPRAVSRVVPVKHLLIARHRTTIGIVSCATICRVAPGRAQVMIGGRHYLPKVTPRGALAAEATVPIRVVLSRKALRALKRVGRGSIEVTISVTDDAGQILKREISVKIRA
jgi:hypothetical protein